MRDSFNAGEKQLVTQNPKMAKVMEDVQKLKRFELEEKVAKLLDHLGRARNWATHGNLEQHLVGCVLPEHCQRGARAGGEREAR